MNDNIKIGADINAGDGGYSEGTQEKYDEFAKGRNQSLGKMRIKQLKEQAMEWVPNMADPDTKIRLLNAEKFAELIVRECAGVGYDASYYECALNVSNKIKEHFGIEE
jgi:hypothetical protein